MGKEIVYCSGCGHIIREADFARGKAATHESRAYCAECRPVAAPPPKESSKPNLSRVLTSAPVEAPRDSRKRILVGGGAAAAAAIVLVLVLVIVRSGKREAPPAPVPDPSVVLLQELEQFAAASPDPEGILRRCGEARPKLAGTAQEPGLWSIEERARKAKEQKEREAKLNALLETARKMQEGDPKFQKQDGVRALFDSALEVAGPRAEEVEKLRAQYEKKAEAATLAALPKEPAPAPPPPPPAPEIPNRPPQVAITSPQDGARFSAPAEIPITAVASDPDGKVAKVEFLLGPMLLGEAVEAPYACVWKNVSQPGTYTLTVRATDDAGTPTVSAVVTVVVVAEKKRSPFGGAAFALPGRIQAEDFDKGDEGVSYHDLDPENRGGKYRETGVDIEPAQDGGAAFCVASARAGEWLEYTVDVAEAGTYSIEVRVSSAGLGGIFHLEFTGVDKTGPLQVPDSRAWTTVRKAGIRLEAGEQILRLVLDKDGPSQSVGSFNYLSVTKDAPAPEAAKPAVPAPKPGAKGPAKPDPLLLKVDEAIRKGMEYLKTRPDIHPQYKELVMLTYLHAGMAEKDAKFQPLLKSALTFANDGYSARTYNISLLAMVLEELDRVTYQADLYKCAQFLVDNEATNGQWGYGAHTTYLDKIPTTAAKSVATGSKSKPASKTADPYAQWGPRPKPAVKFNIKVKPQRAGPDHGDNSNSQYAALGLRACHDGGIVFPKELVERARKWWVDCQQPVEKKNKPDVATGAAIGEPRGWGYLSDGKVPSPGYYHPTGSMTAGAVGGLCIYDYMLGLNWKGDPSVRDGMAWLSDHFAVTGNPLEEKGKTGQDWHYYYLYAIERVGMLYGTNLIGRHDWYVTGARHLLEKQQADGSWNEGKYHGSPAQVLDTCYAILFLRRVTRPLQDVASVDPTR